jgi:GNAT superfamily N-acetyltransferase
MHYKLASHNDLPDIITMTQTMFQEAGVAMGSSNEKLIECYHDYYDQRIAFYYVLTVDERPVGMAGGFLKNDFPFCLYPNPVYGFVGDVFIAPDFRRQGYARILSGKVIQQLKKQGVDTIRLLASHAARPLYEQLGFSPSDMMAMQVK